MRRPLLLACLSQVVLYSQCIVNNPGGSKVNLNRPSDSDTPAATFSPLSTLNDGLPDWLCFTAGYRARFESNDGAGFERGASDSYLLTRFRFGMSLKPASWLKVYSEVQDADAFAKAPPRLPPYQETWDLRRAYVDIGDVDEGRWGFRVGRQDLNFEDGRLIGTSYWRNASRGYDGVQAVLNLAAISTTAFAASRVIVYANGLSHHPPGDDLYGLNSKLGSLVPGGRVETFLFWRLTPGLKTEAGAPGEMDDKTIGARLSGLIGKAWDYDTEGAGQVGHLGTDKIGAWAWMGIGGYTFPNFRPKTRLFAEYNFASGDSNPTDGRRGTFDQLYPSIHDHLGLADEFARQNLKALRSGFRLWLRRNWTLATTWNDYWLASATDGFYNSTGVIVARDPNGKSGTHIGQEYDLETSYRVNRDFEFGAGLGRLFPGEFLVKTHHPSPYTYPYVMMNYNFL
jgi:Alginate export